MDQFLGVVIVRITKDQPISIGECNVLGASHYGREKRVCNIRDDHPDHIGFVTPKSTCKLARLIAGSLHCLKHALSQRLPNAGRIVEHMRNRTKRDAGNPGDVFHVGHQRFPCAKYERGGFSVLFP